MIDRRSAATYRGTTKSTQQIGTELGVRYLLEGVVRWAKDGAGVWRARVTPTLVDAKSGAIKWTGEPAEVTLADPFTAQGTIATDVAKAMEVAVLPTERVALIRRFTDIPQAYEAYLRGINYRDAAARGNDWGNPQYNERVAREMATAIALDSNFTMAWGWLALSVVRQSMVDAQNPASLDSARVLLRLAQRRAPDEPLVLLAAAMAAYSFDHNRPAGIAMAEAAAVRAPHDAYVQFVAGSVLVETQPQKGTELFVLAAKLDPRSPRYLFGAGWNLMARKQRRLGQTYVDAILAIDSADESGWLLLFQSLASAGDSVRMRQFSETMLSRVAHPGYALAGATIPANRRMSQWYLNLAASDQRLFSFSDSLIYFDNRIDAEILLGNTTLGMRDCEEVVRLFNLKRAQFVATPDELAIVAYAEAFSGHHFDARRTLARAIDLARKSTHELYPIGELDASRVAPVYDRLGDAESTVAWMDESLRGYATPALYAIHPRLASFRTTQAWQDFVKAHPVEAH